MKRLHCLPRRHWTNRMRSSGPQPVLLWWWWRPSLDYSWLSFYQHLSSSTLPAISLRIQDVSFPEHCVLMSKKLSFFLFIVMAEELSYPINYSIYRNVCRNDNNFLFDYDLLCLLVWTQLFNYFCFVVCECILCFIMDSRCDYWLKTP